MPEIVHEKVAFYERTLQKVQNFEKGRGEYLYFCFIGKIPFLGKIYAGFRPLVSNSVHKWRTFMVEPNRKAKCLSSIQ